MNKFQLISSILVFSFFAVSCGDDDDETPAPVSDIVGSWNLNDADLGAQINGSDLVDFFIDLGLSQTEALGFEALILSEAGGFETDGVFTFNADGTVIISEPGLPDEQGTYSLNSDESEITITSDGETIVGDVVTLNSSQMVLSIMEENREDLDDDGTLDVITVNIELRFSRR